MSILFEAGSTPPILIHLDSSHSNSENGIVTINLNNSIDRKRQELFLLSLDSAQIPHSFYQMNESNNRLDIVIEGTQNILTLLLQPGNYTAITLQNLLMTKFKEVGIEIKIKFDMSRVSGKYDFYDSNQIFTIFFNEKSMFKQLGFLLGDEIIIKPDFKIQSSYPINLNSIVTVQVHLKNLTYLNSIDCKNGGGYSDILASVDVHSEAWGSINYYSYMSGHKLLIQDEYIYQLDFYLTDQDGNAINFNKQDFQMSLLIEHCRVPSFDDEVSTYNIERIKQIQKIEEEPVEMNKPGKIYTQEGIDELAAIIEATQVKQDTKDQLYALVYNSQIQLDERNKELNKLKV